MSTPKHTAAGWASSTPPMEGNNAAPAKAPSSRTTATQPCRHPSTPTTCMALILAHWGAGQRRSPQARPKAGMRAPEITADSSLSKNSATAAISSGVGQSTYSA